MTHTLGPIKGSNFVGIAFPCTSQEQQKQQLQTVRTEHPRAHHHCRAYRLPPTTRTDILGQTQLQTQKEHHSDDGEPRNTAGKPILKVIQGYNLYAIHIIIVRYYGGTKLGIGGLIQAYTQATQNLIEKASQIQQEITQKISLQFPYACIGKAMHILQSYEADIHTHICKKSVYIEAYINKGLTGMVVEECANTPEIAVKSL